MPIEPWLLPVLWREHDWPAALVRVRDKLAAAPPSTQAQRAAIELGHACEYIDPDRMRALAAYELAGGVERSRDLAIELGAWGTVARTCLALRAYVNDPELIIDEAVAWWDAGQPALCALALAGLRDAARTPRAHALAALVAGRDLDHHERVAVMRATEGEDGDEAEEYTIAGRIAIAAGRRDDGMRWLEAAMVARPGHSVASRLLLSLVVARGDHELMQRYLRFRLRGLDLPVWLDNVRACAIAMIGSEHHKGLGTRLLRQALERAYGAPYAEAPGHLAMWCALARRAASDETRQELLPLVVRAIEWSRDPVDHVWLGALATEISLHDANAPVIAAGYADIVAEHAPEHPIVRELVKRVKDCASPDVPADAVAAAAAVHASLEPEEGLDTIYASATGVATFDADVDEIEGDDWDNPMVKPANPAALLAAAGVSQGRLFASRSLANGTLPPRTGKPAAVAPVLAALRTQDRPTIPRRAGPPADAPARARRIAMPIDVRMHARSGAVIEAHSRDISTTGLFVITDATLSIGDELDIEVRLPDAEPISERGFMARARVVRKDRGGYGIELVTPREELVGALAELERTDDAI